MKEFDVEERVNQSIQYFKSGYNCSQSVFMAYADLFDLDQELAKNISVSFGGGMGRMREVCGTVSGMALLAGFKYPVPDTSNQEARKKNYEAVQNDSWLYDLKYKKYIMPPVMSAGILMLIYVMYFSQVTTTNDACVEYIKSGRMKQYAQVRKEQHRVLSDNTIEDALVPEMGDQYPLLNMSMLEDANNSRNIDRALYYGKNSVTVYMVE